MFPISTKLASIALGLVIASAVVLAWSADARTRLLVVNTLLLAAGTCALSLPLGTLLALWVVKTDLPGRRAAAVLSVVLLLIPLYLQAAGWQAGFGLEGWYTLAYQGPPLVEGWRGAVWIHALTATPWVALIVGVGLWSVEPELEEEALLSGTPGQVFGRVTLRRAIGAALIAALWVAVTTAADMTVTDLFQIRTFAEEVYTDFSLGRYHPLAADEDSAVDLATRALATAILIGAAAIACAYLAPQMSGVSWRPPRLYSLGKWRAPAAVAMWGLIVLVIGVPLGNLVYKAGVLVTQTETGRVRSWSAAKCLEMIGTSPADHGREFGWSLVIAVSAATAALALAVMLAWLAQSGRRGSLPVLVVTAMALGVPGPVLGVELIGLLNRPEVPGLVYLYDRTMFAPWLAQTVKALPLATLILWHALATVPVELLQSAESEGAGGLTRLWRVALPIRWPAVVAAWCTGFIVAFGELAATVIVVPPGMTTLPVHIFGLLHYGVEDKVAGICLALVGLVALLGLTALAAIVLSRRDTAGGRGQCCKHP